VDSIKNPFEREERAQLMLREGRDIHYHCWNFIGLFQMFDWATDRLKFKCSIEYIKQAGHESFVVLRKKNHD
jgi:hypothetical protein